MQWFVNGILRGTTATLDSSWFAHGDTVYVEVTPNDGTVDGAVVTSDTATVVNTAPVMTSATISPATAYTTTGLTGAGSATDADGDTISYAYQWTVNGTPVGTGTTLASSAFVKHDVIGLSVTPNDGLVDGSALAASTVTILNTAPTAPVVDMSPLKPRSTDDLACLVSAESTDADGDGVTYTITWTVNGAPYGGPTSTTVNPGDTILAANVSNNQTWACTFVPNDGEANGPSAQASVKVSDSDGTVRHTNGTWLPVNYVLCGSGAPGSCTAAAAKNACQAKGMKVVSHASNGTSTTYSLGATASCYWDASYYTVNSTMPPGSCLVAVSNLDWSSCCTTVNWHGNTINFGSAGAIFGYVRSGDSGYVASYSNVSGGTWGCQALTSAAANVGGCTKQYVACTP